MQSHDRLIVDEDQLERGLGYSSHLLAIRLQTLHNTRNTKFIIPLGTV